MLLETISDLARRAGAITLEHFQTALSVDTKQDDSPVTVADRQSEEFLRAEIGQLFPDDAVLGEEFGESGAGARRRWILDPIDGTRSFIRGVPLYGVMIGVEEEGEIVAGAVVIPALGELVAAEKGQGCWWNGRRTAVSPTDSLANALLCTTDMANLEKYGRGPAFARLSAAAGLTRTWGDCYGHILVATGRAEVMIDPIVSVWDAAPLLVIIEEAGGRFSSLDGERTVHAKSAISTNAALYAQALAYFATEA